MESNAFALPSEIETAVALHHGGPVAVPGQQGEHVVMSMAVFRDMMGVGTEEQLSRSVEALKESLAQAAAGETMSLEEAAARLSKEHGG
jgi:hypothetical protein